MIIDEIKTKVQSPVYDFLRTDPHLGNRIILLAVAGSHAYGTQTVDSDIDIRGCTLNSERELLGAERFEQFTNQDTDTVIYSFNKFVSLLSKCNPNIIELLGLQPEHYLYLSPIGQEILDNTDLFLSRKVYSTFCGYAMAQLKRLKNATEDAGVRNRNAIMHKKCGKYMMHLIRLYVTGIDILQEGKIITYREKEHDLLMDIRSGRYLDENDRPVPAFYEMVEDFEEKMKKAKENSPLPSNPNYNDIQNFMIKINRIAIEKHR